ncbi:hypothetical protein E2C01_014049 [Portunus trituberculatus]|uniref:Uncharacterized protein n=1 Tax=Portunus trituberculatus TaxID=210409 RepID=A0A5B7DJ17_PORTR|nr:hypothetical protein [Portunus trituberculatus]
MAENNNVLYQTVTFHIEKMSVINNAVRYVTPCARPHPGSRQYPGRSVTPTSVPPAHEVLSLIPRLLAPELVQVRSSAARSPHDRDFISITLLSWVSGFCRPEEEEGRAMCEGTGGKHGRRER